MKFRCLLIVWCLVFAGGCYRIRPPRKTAAIERVMVVTGYCKCGECCSWHRNWYGMPIVSRGPDKGKRKLVGVTAGGSRASVGTIAADTSVYPFGTVMYVEGYGYGRVEDRGSAIKGNHIDLFFRSHRQARQWGRKTMRVKIWLPRQVRSKSDQ